MPIQTTPKLTHYFKVEYNDGTTFDQHKDDLSLTKEGGSSFSDVTLDEIKRFSLVGDQTYTVDLSDGHFEVNGVPFTIHEQNFEPKNLRLVYFREARIDKTGDLIKHYINRYFIGWQTTDSKGKNIQHTLAVQ